MIKPALLLTCLATALALGTPEPAPIRIDLRANTFVPATQDQAVLAFAPDGDLLVAWHSRRQQDGGAGSYWQRFAADGGRRGGEQPLFASPDRQQREPALAVSSDGRPWLGYVAFGQDGDQGGCYLRRPDGTEILVHDTTRGDQSGLQLAARGAGGVAAWITQEADGTRRGCVRAFDATGRPCGGEQRLDPRGDGEQHLSLATRSDGAVVIAWTAFAADRRPAGVRAAVLAADGSLGPVLQVAAGPHAIEPSVAASAQGFTIAWLDNSRHAEHYDILACEVRGREVGPAHCLAVAGDQPQSGVCLAASARGGIALAYTHGERACVQRFAPGFVPTGGIEQVERAQTRAGCLAFGPQGQLGLAWSGACEGDADAAGLTLWLPPSLPARHEPAPTATWPQAPAPAPARIVASEATPHDPPTYAPPAHTLPNGGDLHPAGTVDHGFIAHTNTGWTPPDPHVAVGPRHVVTIVNGELAFFEKSGKRTFAQMINNTGGFWGSLGATNFVFDPEVVYDPHARRYLAMAAERASPPGSFFLLAVSDDDDPNGTWHKYRLNVTTQAGGNDIDSPNLAVDANAVYLSADFFTGATKYLLVTLDKPSLLAGQPPATVRYDLITGTQSHGLPVIYGTAPAMYLVEAIGGNQVRFHAITNPLTAPVRTTTTLGVPAYSAPNSLPQLGTTTRVTTFGTRFWSCVYRNGSLWACHHIGNPTLARWYEFKMNGWPTSGTPSLAQSGDINPGAGIYTSFNSISVDAFGNAMTCFARSSPTEYISIGRAYRLATDPPGTMRPMDIVKPTTGLYATSRWGDYSAVVVDPVDDATFWYHHEYSPGSTWNTWVGARSVASLPLGVDTNATSQASGALVTFSLANPAKANKPYVLLGTLSGTEPGFLLPGPPGNIRMPLNPDGLTLATASIPGFLGTLDATGKATIQLTIPPLPGLLGKTFHFAYAQDGTLWDFASNPVAIHVVP